MVSSENSGLLRPVPPPPSYPLSHTQPAAELHHRSLSELLDPVSIEYLEKRAGNLLHTGCTVWEAGAGFGTLALYMARRVGPGGYVVATDVDVRHVPTHDAIRVQRHDLRNAETVLGAPFHVIHSRLVLQHLAQREEILSHLVGALRPGGVYIEEGWSITNTDDVVLQAAGVYEQQLFNRFQRAMSEEIFAGTDRRWISGVADRLATLGLERIDVTIQDGQVWGGGTAGLRLAQANLTNFRTRLIELGFSTEELMHLYRICDLPSTRIAGHPFYQVSGYLPDAGPQAA